MHAFLEREIDKGAVGFKSLGTTVAFQDACRQSRFNGQSSLPRKLIRHFAPNDLSEPSTPGGSLSTCCGNSAWTGCDSYSKAMQVDRLLRIRDTGSGSDLLLTACPKCQIHLRCAMEDAIRGKELKMETMDLTSAIAKTIYWK